MNTEDKDAVIEMLARLLRKLGLSDGRSLARAQVEHGIPYVHRRAFLRAMWSLIPDERDMSWIQAEIDVAKRDPTAPYAGGGLSLESLLAKGATPEELTELVRAKMAEFLFGVAYRLEDPMFEDEELRAVSWGLFITDEEGNPVAPLTGLHESILQADPTGREVRPRKRP